MGTIIPFSSRADRQRKDAQIYFQENYCKRICRQNDFTAALKKAVDIFSIWNTKDNFQNVSSLLEKGLEANYELHLKARCGKLDSDVEIELVPDESGVNFYYAVYTDDKQANYNDQATYYSTDYKISLKFLIQNIKDERMMAGICINPHSSSGCIIPRQELQQIYAQVVG